MYESIGIFDRPILNLSQETLFLRGEKTSVIVTGKKSAQGILVNKIGWKLIWKFLKPHINFINEIQWSYSGSVRVHMHLVSISIFCFSFTIKGNQRFLLLSARSNLQWRDDKF